MIFNIGASGFVIISRQCEIYRVADSFPIDTVPDSRFLTPPRRKALAVALFVFVALLAFWWGAHVWYRNVLLSELRGDVLAELDPYGNALTIDLRRRIDLIYGLRGWAITNPSTAQLGANFDTFVRELTQGIDGIRNINIAPAGTVRFVYPRDGNEAILGRDLVNDSREAVRNDVARAIKSRKVVVSAVHDLVVGGFGATVRLAFDRGDVFWGLVNLNLDLPPILAESGIASQRNLRVALRDSAGRTLFGEKATFDDNPILHRIGLPDGHWELAAVPVAGWNAANRQYLAIFDVGVLASALLLSAIVYLVAFRDARLALRVAQGTRELSAELQHRTTVEAELRAMQSRYQTLVEVNPDAVLVNYKKKIVYANNAASRLLGASAPEDLLGRSPFDFVDPERKAEVERRYERALISGQANPPSIQRRFRLDGSLVFVETVAAPLAWDDGTAVQVIMRDVTEQRRAEAWVRSLIDTTQDAVVSIDRQARIVLFNPAAQRIFGYQPNEVVGQKVNMLMPEPYFSQHDGYIEQYERTGKAQAIGRIRTVTAKRKNGEIFPIELSVALVPTDLEVQYGAFIRDISEKTRLQQKAVESDRLATIGTMAAKFGHELGNPLNGMSLTIQLLEQRLRKQLSTLDEPVSSTLTRLKTEISRLNSLLQDFRSLSRKETYNFQRVHLAELVTEAIEIELPGYAERGVNVEKRFAPELPRVSVDTDKMKQVILNLAKNAVEAMPHGGNLLFAGSSDPAAVTLEVSDTGAGIPGEIDVFEPFFTTKSYGTGIGMTIVRQILAAHGGSISYTSQLGKGTTFTIQLPLGD